MIDFTLYAIYALFAGIFYSFFVLVPLFTIFTDMVHRRYGYHTEHNVVCVAICILFGIIGTGLVFFLAGNLL